MNKIDKQAVKRLSRTMHLYGSHWKVGNVFSEQRAADCDKAAETLLTLLAALDAAEAQNRKLGDMVHKRGNDLAEVRHQLKRAEAEKRAAVTLLQEIATSGRCDFQKVRDTLTAIRETNDG
jgi:hypothetical protein